MFLFRVAVDKQTNIQLVIVETEESRYMAFCMKY